MRTVKITDTSDYILNVIKVLSIKRYNARLTKGKIISIALNSLYKQLTEGEKDEDE